MLTCIFTVKKRNKTSMAKFMAIFPFAILGAVYICAALGEFFNFQPNKLYICLGIAFLFWGVTTISCATIANSLADRGFELAKDYPALLTAYLIFCIDASPAYFIQLKIDHALNWSLGYLFFFIIAYNTLLNLIIILIYLIRCHSKENYLKKLPCIRNESMFNTAYENPQIRTYLACYIPFTAQEFKDPNKLLRRDYVYIEYLAQFYKKVDHSLQWDCTDVNRRQIPYPYIASDISIANRHPLRLDPDILINLKNTTLNRGNFNTHGGAKEYFDSVHYYPNGKDFNVNDMRYCVRTITADQRLAFIAAIGNKTFKLLPLLPHDKNFTTPQIYVDADEDYIRYKLLSNNKKNMCCGLIFIQFCILAFIILSDINKLG